MLLVIYQQQDTEYLVRLETKKNLSPERKLKVFYLEEIQSMNIISHSKVPVNTIGEVLGLFYIQFPVFFTSQLSVNRLVDVG